LEYNYLQYLQGISLVVEVEVVEVEVELESGIVLV
jgi:hypothetical protein